MQPGRFLHDSPKQKTIHQVEVATVAESHEVLAGSLKMEVVGDSFRIPEHYSPHIYSDDATAKEVVK
jgi:hypothetical protein